jgi:5'-methylthioadenosine phosphorylase
MTASVLGIIGGSGVYDIEMDNARWETIASPWGEPSDQVRRGEIAGLPVVFLPRHGRGHVYSPTTINFRANIDVMKRAGVTDLISRARRASSARASWGMCLSRIPFRRAYRTSQKRR